MLQIASKGSGKVSKSIISNEKQCLVCGRQRGLHKHHIFYGTANRRISEIDGCWCYLCAKHHNMSNYAVHFEKKLDLALKEYCQKKWEERYGSREDFIKRYGRNYIDD